MARDRPVPSREAGERGRGRRRRPGELREGAGPHRLSYVFASFGAEEIGLGGSRYYLTHPVLPTVLALSLDEVGQANGQRLTLLDAWSLPAPLAWELGQRAQAAGLVDAPPGRGTLALVRLEPLLGAGVTDSLPFALRRREYVQRLAAAV